jgi:hypothetical protein
MMQLLDALIQGMENILNPTHSRGIEEWLSTLSADPRRNVL